MSKPPSCSGRETKAWRWFMRFTTLGGISQSHDTDFRLSKVLWLVVFVVFAALTVWNVEEVVSDYLSNPITTTVTVNQNDSVTFPAVTVCNLNTVHCGNLYKYIVACSNGSAAVQRTSSCGDAAKIGLLCSIYGIGLCETAIKIAELAYFGVPLSAPICQNTSLPTTPDMASAVFTTLYNQLGEDDKFAIGAQPADLFRSCSFGSDESNPECAKLRNGTNRLISPSMGPCFTFNYFPPGKPGSSAASSTASSANSPLNTTLTGQLFGLSLVIKIDLNYNMLNGLTQSEGVKIIVHDNTRLPLTASSGMLAPPSVQTNLAMQQETISRQPAPYVSNCTSQWPMEYQGPERQYPYAARLCQSVCLDNIVTSECNCSYPLIVDLMNNGSRVCDFNDANDQSCVKNVTSEPRISMLLGDRCSSCQPECYEASFRVTPSGARWPSFQYWPYIAQMYNETYAGQRTTALTAFTIFSTVRDLSDPAVQLLELMMTACQGNYLSVNVYYETKGVVTTTEDPAYTAETFAASLGGALGLYLGVSFVSIFEVVDLIAHCAYYISGKDKGAKGRGKVAKQEAAT